MSGPLTDTPPLPARTRLRRFVSFSMSGVIAFALLCAATEWYFRYRYGRSYTPDSGIRADSVLGWDSIPPVTPLPLNDGHGDTVLFLGDSFTDRKEWPAEAQRQLAAAGLHADGYNLGVTGFGTAQELMKFEQHAERLAPSAVVVLFFAWNDLRDNYPYPEIFYGPQRASRPYLLTDGRRVTQLPVTWASSVSADLLGSEMYLRVFNRVSLRWHSEVVRRWPALPSSLGWRARLYYEDPVSWHPFYQAAKADSSYVSGAYATTIESFRRIRDLAARTSAPLLVIGIDNAFTVDRDVFEHYVEPYPDLDPSLPLARMSKLLEHERIAFVNARPDLAALREQTGQRVYNGPVGGMGLAGHLQPEADRLIGAIAARWLRDELAPASMK